MNQPELPLVFADPSYVPAAFRGNGRRVFEHVRVFMENNPPGPWKCYFCGSAVVAYGRVDRFGGAVHHIDGNHSNNAVANLVMAHVGCHNSYHCSRRRLKF